MVLRAGCLPVALFFSFLFWLHPPLPLLPARRGCFRLAFSPYGEVLAAACAAQTHFPLLFYAITRIEGASGRLAGLHTRLLARYEGTHGSASPHTQCKEGC